MSLMVMAMAGKWGTWEELLLGGAIIRHGYGDWDVIAGELHARSLCPKSFTPEACKSKYEELQQCYSGCKSLFEVLKKKRMAELRAALEQSEDSIGSLESKLESLKSESKDESPNNYDSSRTISTEPFQKSEGAECSSKDTDISKDLSSAGSFTLQNEPNSSPEPKLSVSASIQDENSQNCNVVKQISWCDRLVPSMKRRRGKRKRKDGNKDVKERSVEESEFLGSCADAAWASMCKDMSTSNYGADDQGEGNCAVESDELMKLYNSIAENDCALVFRRRRDSQKRGRFKQLVRRHMDMDTIKSRISNRSIVSAKELFRDLLLVANNALLFYSKNTREYKSAFCLRNVVSDSIKKYMEHEDPGPRIHAVIALTCVKHPAKKPRSIRSPKQETPSGVLDAVKTPNGGKRTSGTESPSVGSLIRRKKATSGPRKVAGRCSKLKSNSSGLIGRRRTRVR